MIDKSFLELSTMLQRREVSSVEISRAFLEKISSSNDSINAYITVCGDSLLEAARASDERRSAGRPLSAYDGVPVAVKDNICTSGVKTTCASKILSDFIPPYNATSYEKLTAAGCVLLGKTNLDEFAMGSSTETSYFGITRNPHNLECVPGGSSGGSAAAVSACMAPAALGSDTGGSIRQPAAFCGVPGIKPTYGRVSRYGLVAYASSLDQIGTFGRTVDDAALVLSIISGHDEKDSTSIARDIDFTPDHFDANVKGMVIGVPEEYYKGISPEIDERIRMVLAKLEGEGARIESISLKLTEYAIPVYYLIATAEASSNLARYDGVRYGYRSPNISNVKELYLRSRSEGFGSEVKRRIILGTFSLSSGYYDAYYLKALKVRSLFVRDFISAFAKVDAVITPVTTTTAFRIGELINDPLHMYMSDILTISANLAGIPGISVPAGFDSAGLPIGIQVMGGHFQEKKILNTAKAIERCNCQAGPKTC